MLVSLYVVPILQVSLEKAPVAALPMRLECFSLVVQIEVLVVFIRLCLLHQVVLVTEQLSFQLGLVPDLLGSRSIDRLSDGFDNAVKP